MRFQVEDVSFTGPSGLEDCTSYSFKATQPRAELFVEFERPAGDATPASEVLADVRQQHVDYLEAQFVVDDQGQIRIAGAPADYMQYQVDDDGVAWFGLIAVANLGSAEADGDWVKLAWQHEASATDLRALVDAVAASFAKASDPPPVATPPGWTRRQADIWAFDLPADFIGPRSFIWMDVDAELRVQLTIHPYGADKPELDARVAAVESRGQTILAREDVPIIYGDLVRLHTRDDLDEEWFACRVVQAYEVGNPVRVRWIEVAADGPFTEQADLRRIIDGLLASLVVKEQA